MSQKTAIAVLGDQKTEIAVLGDQPAAFLVDHLGVTKVKQLARVESQTLVEKPDSSLAFAQTIDLHTKEHVAVSAYLGRLFAQQEKLTAEINKAVKRQTSLLTEELKP